MSLINNRKLPVMVFRSDDVGAPVIDGQPNSFNNLLKSCLVDGYGDKLSAGWELVFNNADNTDVVFRTPRLVVGETDIFLKSYDDDGRNVTTKAYTNMTDLNTGVNELYTRHHFKYRVSSGAMGILRWVLISSSRGFWFLCETEGYNTTKPPYSGSFFFIGDSHSSIDGSSVIILDHSSGSYNDGDIGHFLHGIEEGRRNNGVVLYSNGFKNTNYISLFNGATSITTNLLLSPIYLTVSGSMSKLPVISTYSNISSLPNFHINSIIVDAIETKMLVFSTGANSENNYAFNITEWVY